MVRRYLNGCAAIALCAVLLGVAPPPSFDNPPPGAIVQDMVAYLSGEGMNSAWRVVTSRRIIGSQLGKEPAYQWYVSFYAPGPARYRLAYRLPNRSGLLLDAVAKANGAQLYFPRQDVRITGAGELERSGVQDVVIASHQSAADCGTSDVTVFGADPAMHVRMLVHVSNACDLQATLVHNAGLQAVRLNGPYYGRNAALCCPTNPHASAVLAFAGGTWRVRPPYFIISASLAAHHRPLMSERVRSKRRR